MHNLFLVLHIIGGGTALISGFIAMLTKKGAKPHKLTGKIFFWAMTVSCSSAVYLAIVRPNQFLLMVAFFSYQLVAIGYRSVFLKKLYTGTIKPKLVDWLIGVVPAVFNLCILFWGVLLISQKRYFGVMGIVFGCIGLVYTYNWLRSFYVPPKAKQHWMFSHFQSLGAAYIATFTAFLVVNNTLLPGLLAWLLPSIVGSVIITLTSIKYRKKFAK